MVLSFTSSLPNIEGLAICNAVHYWFYSVDSIVNLCASSDIILLQETWLCEDELHMLNSIHNNLYACGVSSMKSDEKILCGRPHGGIAVLWNKGISDSVRVDIVNDRLMCAHLNFNNQSVLLLYVYMPYDDRSQHSDNYELYMSILGDIHTVAAEASTTSIVVMGNWNCNVHVNSVFGRELKNICSEYNFIITDVEVLGSNSETFTLYSESHDSTSWIDHCICSLQAHNCIDSVNVSYDIMTSDHFPLSINMKLNLLPATQYNNYSIEDNTHASKYCNWSKADHKDKSLYSDMCEHLLSRLSIPNSAL